MGILEKLRPQPRWKHADPGVRSAAVYELGPEEADALLALAREDADSRVRRAAVGRISEVDVLGEIARTDPDEDVRSEAIRGLAGLAAETKEPDRASEVVRQLMMLGRLKEVVVVARENTSPLVRGAVVDLIDDSKSLGSVSRHAQDASTRLRALARLTDPDEILNVALKAEHTDSAVSALERIQDPAALSAIAQRGRNKVAARRARTKLREAEEAAQPQHEAAARMSATDRAKALDLCITPRRSLPFRIRKRRLPRLPLCVWRGPSSRPTSRSTKPRCGSSNQPAMPFERRSRSGGVKLLRNANGSRRSNVSRRIVWRSSRRSSSCQDRRAVDRIAELRVQWDGLPPMPSEYAASLTRRFQDASRAFEDRERRRLLAEAAVGRLDSLATELEQLAASEQPVDDVVARWRGLRRDADVLREHASANLVAAERLERAVAVLEQKENEYQQARAKLEQENLRRLQQFCRQVEALAAAEPLTLKAGDRALREIRTTLEDRAPLPTKRDRQEIQTRLEEARAKLAPRIQELRDADEWQRWANLQVQEEICREMETLKTEANLEVAGRRMRELQARWKQVALAPRAQGEAMWRRFKTAQDEVYARTSAFFAAQNEERAGNLVRKQALCDRAEALADSTDWVKTAAEIQGLQAEWKTIGPVARGHEKAIWERFRRACDQFFTRRQEDLKHRKEEWAGNLARKEALCVAAEELAESTEWDQSAAKLKQLQAEWKKIGPVRKSKSEAIWQRFRAACDRFFDRYKHRDQVELQEKAAVRETVIRDLEALVPQESAEPASAPDNLYDTVHQARAKWQQAPELPRAVQQDLAARYHQAVARLVAAWPEAFAGTDLDPEATRKRMEKLLAKVEELVASQPSRPVNLSPTELLAQKLRERLAANTMAGGARAAEAEDARWRAVEQEVRSAQAQWMRLGPVPPQVAGPLNERFQRACRRFFDQRRRAS